MQTIAKFEKVSFSQFEKDWNKTFATTEPQASTSAASASNVCLQHIYDNLLLPRRATSGSCGYDFLAPCDITLAPGKSIVIPTGIRARIDEGWLLACFPRSGLGFKFRLQLNNTVAIIDSDYYNTPGEGHIFAKIYNGTQENKTIAIASGTGFIQGIFLQYGLCEDDNTTDARIGGLGSTTKS